MPDTIFDDPSQEYDEFAHHCFQVEKNFYICPINPSGEELDGVFKVNPSCDPNCGFISPVTLVSMRDIKPDEEITYDYAMTDVGTKEEGWEDMRCLCGCPNCRKVITGSDWKLPKLQAKYKGYFSPYVQKLFNSPEQVVLYSKKTTSPYERRG